MARLPYHDARVLLLGDGQADLETLEDLLRRDGYRDIHRVDGHAAGAEAVGRLAPDVVVADLDLGREEALRAVESLGRGADDPYLSALVLSFEADQATRLRLLEAGAKDFVTKPFNRAELLNRVRNLVEMRFLYKRLLERNRALERELKTHIARHEAALAAIREAEAKLKSALDDSDRKSRAKSEFLANYSHELRTPLTSILGFAEILKNEAFGPHSNPRYKEYAINIHESGAYLLSLINDILDLSKAEAGRLDINLEEVDVREPLDATMRMFSEQAAAQGIALSVEIPDDFPSIRTDERRLRQVLANLVSNAIKFTPRGGRVVLQARVEPDDGAVILVISDTGVGIAPEDIEKVLAPYGQASGDHPAKRKGTGLGLPLTRRIVEALGGSLDIWSRKGVGTAVSVRFPPDLVIRPAPAPRQARRA